MSSRPSRLLGSLLLLLLLCGGGGGEPLVQQLLAVVDLPAVDLHGNDDHQEEDRHRREAEDDAVGLAVAVELLGHWEHLHGAVDEGSHAEEAAADHGDHQVADVVPGQRQEAEDCGDNAEEIGVLPLVRRRHHPVGHQIQLADHHLEGRRRRALDTGLQSLSFMLNVSLVTKILFRLEDDGPSRTVNAGVEHSGELFVFVSTVATLSFQHKLLQHSQSIYQLGALSETPKATHTPERTRCCD